MNRANPWLTGRGFLHFGGDSKLKSGQEFAGLGRSPDVLGSSPFRTPYRVRELDDGRMLSGSRREPVEVVNPILTTPDGEFSTLQALTTTV